MRIPYTKHQAHAATGVDALYCMWFGRYAALAVERRDQGNVKMARFFAQEAREGLAAAMKVNSHD